MHLPESIVDAVSQGKLPRLALVVAVMILRHPQELYKVDEIAEWCGIARRTTFLMLSHLRDVHFEIIQQQNGLKIVQIGQKNTEIALSGNSAPQCTPEGGDCIPDDYPSKEALHWAQSRYPEIDIKRAAQGFRDHHIMKQSRRQSWEAAWRSWMARAHKDPKDGQTRTSRIGAAVGLALRSNPFAPG